jgi:hypothetical protein
MIAILAALVTALTLIALILWWTFRGVERRDLTRRKRRGWRRGVARLGGGAQAGGEADEAFGLGHGGLGASGGSCGSPGGGGGGGGGD